MSSILRLPNLALTAAGFDENGLRLKIPNNIDDQLTNTQQEFPDLSLNGEKIENLNVSKLRAGTLTVDTFIKSTGYVAGTTGWRIDGAGNAEFANITLSGGTLNYGKTSFADSTHSGYYISSDGIYFGQASDTTKLKFSIAGGTLDLIGTISSRSTATIAGAINSSGNLVTDLINARLDSSTKKILSDFNFGTGDYAGAVNAGNVTWNSSTGAITGGSGVLLYRGGIVGVNSGVSTFTIDAATGAATFAGTLSAPSGTIGGFTIGATTLSAASGGNTTTLSSGSTAFSAGPTGSPTVTITQAGVLTATGAVVNGSALTNNDIFGSGEDGAFALDGTNTYATFYSKSGSTYTQLQDVFASDMTLSSSAIIITNGYRLFVKNTLTIGSGSKIKWNGNNGSNGANASTNAAVSGGAGGAALSSANVYGSGAGKAGGDSGAGGSAGGGGFNGVDGVAGSAITNSFAVSYSSTSGAGGTGGGTSPGSGGNSGATGTISASSIRPYTSIFAVEMFDKVAGSSPALLKYNSNVGGAGGGGGGKASAGSGLGGAGGAGGGSGSGGGTIVIAARIIVNSGSIESVGGNGGNGGNGANGTATGSGANNAGGGGGGGGTGGPGGVIVLIYSSYSGAGTTSVAGGSGGTKGAKGNQGTGGTTTTEASAGSDGSTGVSGKLITLVV